MTAAVSCPVGAHAPTAGGIDRVAPGYVDRVGAECVQVFVGNPRGWATPQADGDADARFAAAMTRRGVAVFVHAALLVNLGSPSAQTVANSVRVLAYAHRRAARLGAAGVVFHAGSAVLAGRRDVAFAQVREALLPLLDASAADGGPALLVEPSAGGGQPLVARVEELAEFVDAVDAHPALGVCLDTCHAFAAGHDVTSAAAMGTLVDAVADAAGPERLSLVHANDSKDPVGSRRDRHESIGAGHIGAAGFAGLFGHPGMAGVPVVVETPGGVRGAGHAADIAALRRMRDR